MLCYTSSQGRWSCIELQPSRGRPETTWVAGAQPRLQLRPLQLGRQLLPMHTSGIAPALAWGLPGEQHSALATSTSARLPGRVVIVNSSLNTFFFLM